MKRVCVHCMKMPQKLLNFVSDGVNWPGLQGLAVSKMLEAVSKSLREAIAQSGRSARRKACCVTAVMQASYAAGGPWHVSADWRAFSASSLAWQAGQRHCTGVPGGRFRASQSLPSAGRCRHQQLAAGRPACCAHWLGQPHSGQRFSFCEAVTDAAIVW